MTDGTTGADHAPERCADAARAAGIDPIGSAGSYDDFLLVEWPLPWPRDAADVPELASVVEQIRRSTPRLVRLQLVVGDDRPADEHSVILYRRRTPGFCGFDRIERCVDRPGIGRVCEELLATPHEGGDADATRVVDLLLCAHGTRDICCGSRGTRLVGELTGQLPEHVRLWRTSHTGGHRFAPTGITLPDGQYWAFLDARAVRRIVERDTDPAPLGVHHRGSAGSLTPACQAVDRQLFLRHGWEWLRWRRQSDETEGPTPDQRVVRVDVGRPDGARLQYRAEVVMRTAVELARCRAASADIATTDEQPRVVAIHELPFDRTSTEGEP